MKIIKQGNLNKPNKTFYKVTCPSCGCVFKFERSEAESLIKGIGMDGADLGGFVKCPCCGNEISFTGNDECKGDNYE